jgi:glutathione S-transferase
MKLFYSNGSPYARKVRIVLAEKNLPYEADVDDRVRPIDEAPGPTLAVPLLIDGDLRIWESDLIVDYLLQTYRDEQPPDGDPPLSPWLARPNQHWQDMTLLATISTYANSLINLRLMLVDGITPENSDYMLRQRTRVERCLDWLENHVTDEGFAPGWFSIMDIAFLCPTGYCEARSIMPWRGRPKLEALFDRHQSRPSLLATQVNILPPIKPRYLVSRVPAG